MPDWQTELQALLSQLQVSQVSLDQADNWQPAEGVASQRPRTADPDGSGPWDLAALASEEVALDGDEVSAVRSEIEATVDQVVALVDTGLIETSMRDDVVFVLQALTRPDPDPLTAPDDPFAPADTRTEWQLASAAAVLRFCRIVQRLTYAVARASEL